MNENSYRRNKSLEYLIAGLTYDIQFPYIGYDSNTYHVGNPRIFILGDLCEKFGRNDLVTKSQLCLHKQIHSFKDKTWWNGPYCIDSKQEAFEIENELLDEYFGIFKYPKYSLGYETLDKFKLKKNIYKKQLFIENVQTYLIKDVIDLIFHYVSYPQFI